MSRLLPLLLAVLLSACSMQSMSEKLVPTDVRDAVSDQLDALVAGESDFIFEAFPDDADDPEFREQMTRMVANVPDAQEISRDVVGVQARTEQSYNTSEGAVRTGTYNLAHEIAFADGNFLLVQTAHTLDARGECCVLRAINATRSTESPVKADLVRQGRIMRFVGLFLLISTLAAVAFLIIRVGGRRARAAQMDARR